MSATQTRKAGRSLRIAILLIAITIPVLFVGFYFWSTWTTRRNAQRFLQDVQRLPVGQASLDDVLRVVRSSGGLIYGFDPCISGTSECTGTVEFRNMWLIRLHLAPHATFGCRLRIANHRLQNRWIEMSIRMKAGGDSWDSGTYVNEAASLEFSPGAVPLTVETKYLVIAGGFPAGYDGVWISPETPASLKALAYDFNFSCLSKLGGCKTSEEMLPILRDENLINQHRRGDVTK